MIRKLTILMFIASVIGATWVGSALGADPEAALIGHWKLDGDTLDASGLENHATAMGNPTFETGLYKQGMYFDGDGDYLVMDSVADDLTDDDVTLSAWVKTGDIGDWQWWFSCNTAAGGNVILLGLIDGYVIVYEVSAEEDRSTTVINDMEWRHVAYSRIGSVGNLYIDGVQEATHDASFSFSANDRWSIAQEWDAGGPSDFLDATIDDVRIYDRGLTQEELAEIMIMDYGVASEPNPANGAIDVLRDVTLSWTPGDYVPATNGHTVYISENLSDVTDGLGGVTVSDSTYQPAQRPDFGTTYYWRVDEVNGAPDYTVHPGKVWSFTVEPMGYPVQGVQVSSNGTDMAGQELGHIVDGSGLDADDLHSSDSDDMWMASPAEDGSLWVQFEFDGIYKLHEMVVWNYNVQFEPMLGFGIANVTVEYSKDGADWMTLGDVDLGQGTGLPGFAADTTVDFGGLSVKYVKLTVNSGFQETDQHGLSEVRFLYIPAHASAPQPADEAVDVSVAATLGWNAGRGAAAHDVYLGTDAETLPLVGSVEDGSYDPAGLDLSTTYYWQIVEVNEADENGPWTGDLWSFSTEEYIVIEDFERYTDDEGAGEAIWQTWIDGFDDTTGNGSQVGNTVTPFAEQEIVHSGNQSMPILYDNVGTNYAEATLNFDTPQDWTQHGITALTLYFRGAEDNQGQLYVKINDAKVSWDGNTNVITKLSWQTWNVDLSTVGTNLTSVQKLAIGVDGANITGTLYVDDVRLHSVPPLAPREPNEANLIAYYPFEGDATDASGNGHDGELLAGPVFVDGVVGQALEFDGYDDVVQVPDDASLNPGDGDFSITFWSQLDPSAGSSGTTVWDLAVNKRQTGSNGYYVGANRDQGGAGEAGFKFMVGNTSAQRVDTPYMLVPLGEWTFITAVLDRTENVHKISVNAGYSWATATPSSGSIAPNHDLGIGFDIGLNNYWFHGKIDEVRLYNIALSDEEAAWLANN